MTSDIISDNAINQAWGNANFGQTSRREIIANALLKYASGYSTGFTIQQICAELKLIGKNKTLTKMGKKYLFEAYRDKLSV